MLNKCYNGVLSNADRPTRVTNIWRYESLEQLKTSEGYEPADTVINE